jgi:hypothetical protein
MKRLALALVPFLALSGVAFAQNTPAPAPQHATVRPMAKMAENRGYENDAAGGRATQALNLLGAKGYGNFTKFRADGTNYQATVTQGGQQIVVTVDPDNGSVTRS